MPLNEDFHLLVQSLALRCGYPMSAIRERIYADGQEQRYGILLYTGSPDSGGMLGGLVQQARHRRAPRPCAAHGDALLERPDLRPA